MNRPGEFAAVLSMHAADSWQNAYNNLSQKGLSMLRYYMAEAGACCGKEYEKHYDKGRRCRT